MSGAGENRWRRPGQTNRQSQDGRSGNGPPTREAGRQQAMNALSGNAWGGAKGKATSGGGDRASTSASVSASASASASAQAEHIPVRDFNADDVKAFLKKQYIANGGDKPSVYHKVQGDSVAKRSSGAWGSKGNMPHLMPNGQDFFTQLKKQLASLDQASKKLEQESKT